MGTVITLPLNSGMDQGVDRVWQDGQMLSYAQNCRLTHDGRLEVRPGFTALATTSLATGSPAMAAYDVANYAGRLVALGDNTASARATDLFEYVPSLTAWRGTAGTSATARLPSLIDVRQISPLPDQENAARNVAMAAGGGRVCVVLNVRDRGSITGGELGSVIMVIDPETDQVVFSERVAALKMARVVFVNAQFQVAGVDGDGDIVSYAVLTALSGPTTRVSLSGDMNDLALCTFGTGFALAYSENGGATVAYTYNSAGTQVATWTVDAADSAALAMAGNAAGTLLSVVRIDDAAETTTIETFDAAGATQSGPTTLFGGTTTTIEALGACLVGTDVLCVISTATDTLLQRAAQSGHALDTMQTYYNARLECAPIAVGTRVFLGVNDAARDSITFHMIDEAQLLPQVYIQFAAGVNSTENATHTPAVLGTKIYFATTTPSEDTGNLSDERRFLAFEAETAGTGRRQMVQVGGELLISGGVPLTYDGRTLAEQGFAERPELSGVEGSGGALTALGVYRAIPLWEVFDAKGRLLHSQAGTFREVTLTGANDQITWTITTPHSLRRHPNYANQGLSVRVRLYRTEAGEGVFFLDAETVVPLSDSPAESVTVVSAQSDALLIDNLVLYEQSQTPVSHVSPPPYRFVAAARERAFVGGLPESEAHLASKLLFPAEPVEFAPFGQLGFSGRVPEAIVGVGAFETVGLVWTESSIWQVPGRGPEHNGEGEFDAAAPIASPGGALDWRSILVTPPGAFFQMRSDRLMLLSRGGEVSWAGRPVQDTLALYPDISGVTFVRDLNQVVFACNNELGTDGVLLVYDLSNQQWFVDTIGAKITSVAEYQGRLVYVSGGVVFLQDAAIATGAGALPTIRLETASLQPFSALGLGDIWGIKLLGTFLGNCTLEAFISYDDGATWVSMGSYAVTIADASPSVLNAGGVALGMVTKEWTPNRRTVDRFRLRFDVSAATNTGAIRLHAIAFEAEAQSGTVRLPSGSKR